MAASFRINPEINPFWYFDTLAFDIQLAQLTKFYFPEVTKRLLNVVSKSIGRPDVKTTLF